MKPADLDPHCFPKEDIELWIFAWSQAKNHTFFQ